ncbi:MAG: TetR/AcrR family transcriptional regulator [Anaerolineales bacterium]
MTIQDIALPKSERTRQTIEDAAYNLFLEQGYHGTSMRQIAERAGLSLGAIYNHFNSKEDIFQALVIAKHPYKQILPLIGQAEGQTAEDYIRNAARAIQQELGRHPDFVKLMFIEIVEFNGRHFPQLFQIIYPHILPALQRLAAPESGVRPLPLPLLLRTLMGSILAFYLTDFLMTDDTLPPDLRSASLEDFLDIYLHGILE